MCSVLSLLENKRRENKGNSIHSNQPMMYITILCNEFKCELIKYCCYCCCQCSEELC